MDALRIGWMNTFEVVEKSGEGLRIRHPEAEIYVPAADVRGHPEVGELVEAFVYINHKKGLAAALKEPFIDLERAGFVEVAGRRDNLGVFVDIGFTKDMLVSLDDLPPLKSEWPIPGDKLVCRLKRSKNQMTAKPVGLFQLKRVIPAQGILEVEERVTAHVVHHALEGVFLFTPQGQRIFVYDKDMGGPVRLGGGFCPRITIKRGSGDYVGSLPEEDI